MNRRRSHPSFDAAELARTAAVACLIAALLTVAVAVTVSLSRLQFGPRVGEILAFRPAGNLSEQWRVRALQLPDQRPCWLQPAVLRRTGGSLVVERRLADGRTFQVHWAGGATSDTPDSCGQSASLLIALPQMQALVTAAGGPPSMHVYFGSF